MFTARDIYELLNSYFPFYTQEEWDNSGLLIDSREKTDKVLICLDVTGRAIDRAVETGAKVIVSHHPVIFGGIKAVNRDDVVYKLIKNDISVISAHTNFDKYQKGTCYAIADKLGLNPVFDENIEIGLPANCEKISCRELAEKCKTLFGSASFTLPDKEINKVFICAGSGGGMIREILSTAADCFITGESKYHDMLDLAALDVAVIEVDHDASEKISLETIDNIIKSGFGNIETEIFNAENLQYHI